jgi:uncharacterized protein
MRTILSVLLSGFALAASAQSGPRVLDWEELMPPGEWDLYDEQYFAFLDQLGSQDIEEGSAADAPMQFGSFNVVDELDGQVVRLPGFVVPFEFAPGQRIREFLLVPYFGACIHLPPPPPNQIVYVTAENAVTLANLWSPVWVEGTLRTAKNLNGLGDAAYTLHLRSMELYQQ